MPNPLPSRETARSKATQPPCCRGLDARRYRPYLLHHRDPGFGHDRHRALDQAAAVLKSDEVRGVVYESPLPRYFLTAHPAAESSLVGPLLDPQKRHRDPAQT